MRDIKKLIDELSTKGTDFAASTYAFIERQGNDMSSINIDDIVTKEERELFNKKLEHYRSVYKKKDSTVL
ncbi:DNA polymerase III subunit theta [Phytobacter sp. V91]|uniref:DNA polymerase III subunit theta n=1 Tax=Phytobacter sp. V91 TaxID=3369425 RepID=UPI003F5DBF06